MLRKLDGLDRRLGARPAPTTDWEERPAGAERTPWWLIAASVSLVIVPAMAILLVQTVRNQQQDDHVLSALERDGALAVGTATDLDGPTRWHVFPDVMRVEFMTEAGVPVRASVPVSHVPEKGAPVEVRYVRSNPSVARVPGDETPHRGRWIIVAGWGPAFLVIMAVVLGLAERSRRKSA